MNKGDERLVVLIYVYYCLMFLLKKLHLRFIVSDFLQVFFKNPCINDRVNFWSVKYTPVYISCNKIIIL